MARQLRGKLRGILFEHFYFHAIILLIAWLFTNNLRIWLIFCGAYLGVVAMVVLRELFLFWRRRQIAKYARQADLLWVLVRELIDLAYTYDGAPEKFYTKFRERIGIESLARRGVIDPEALLHTVRYNRACEGLRREDAELWTFLRAGTTSRELKVIYGLKDLNSVYVKVSRLRSRLDKHMRELLDEERL